MSLKIELDESRDRVTIEGVTFRQETFREFARAMPLRHPFVIESQDGSALHARNRPLFDRAASAFARDAMLAGPPCMVAVPAAGGDQYAAGVAVGRPVEPVDPCRPWCTCGAWPHKSWCGYRNPSTEPDKGKAWAKGNDRG